ncbi:hypothetical protein RhiirA4_550070 [Rhizophagus irregularis]|uniref:Uncharacterized protein n=1 Tax=Rhizophagus irregularis TaxID=588596 RepID=A0A2I1HHX9_9GLOM|nr:hypothetical protein RhiirA4_550070 [Rhizophagus irregularis]
MYHETILDLNILYRHYDIYKYISHIYLFTDFLLYLNVTNNNNDLSKLGIVSGFSKYMYEKYTDFWLYLNVNNNNNDLSELGIVNEFNKYMYKTIQVYFISNLVNLNSELHQLQENDINRKDNKFKK